MLKLLVLHVILILHQGPRTMTSIEQIPGTDSLTITVRFDYDLFLRDFQQTFIDDIELEDLRSVKSFPVDLANHYINSKISIYADSELLTAKVLKLEVVEDNIVMKVFYRLKNSLKDLTVRNVFLIGLFSDVENLTIIKINDLEKGIKFTHEYVEEKFSFR